MRNTSRPGDVSAIGWVSRDSQFEPAVLEISGFAGAVGTVSFVTSVFFMLITFRCSKGGAMKARNFVGATLSAIAAVASAMFASVTAALLTQIGC